MRAFVPQSNKKPAINRRLSDVYTSFNAVSVTLVKSTVFAELLTSVSVPPPADVTTTVFVPLTDCVVGPYTVEDESVTGDPSSWSSTTISPAVCDVPSKSYVTRYVPAGIFTAFPDTDIVVDGVAASCVRLICEDVVTDCEAFPAVIASAVPVGPVGPVAPVSPWMPCKPWIPCAPSGPVSPVGPVGPVGPVL